MKDHYIGLDWAQESMAIARMTHHSNKITVVEVPSSVVELKHYLKQQKGKKILTFEETTTSQWLYTELRNSVDEILVCDPYRNKLLSEGAKTDRIDASKLVTLLKANLLKPVFHTSDNFISYRKMISGYKDLINSGVRLKNQRSALFRAVGKGRKEKTLSGFAESFVLKGVDEGIELYETRKAAYEKEFTKICRKNVLAKNIETISGIGVIGAVKIAAIVVDAHRFKTKNHFLSYCGLVRHELLSGGRSYGKRKPRCCRDLKAVFKVGALSCIGPNSKSPLKVYYNYLRNEKRYADNVARHAVARRLALIVYGVMKSGRRFDPKRIKQFS